MTELNPYIPFLSEITEVIKHTEIEYTFRMTYKGDVKPGQFFEVSLPKFGEAPISVSGIGDGTVDLTIRKVARRLIVHDRLHGRAMSRMRERLL